MAIGAMLRAFRLRNASFSLRQSTTSRFISTLVLAEHEGGSIKSSSISSVEAAKCLSKDNSISMLLAGSGPSLQQAATHASLCHPLVSQVLVADSDKFMHPLAETWANLVELVQKKGGYTHILAASGSFGKNILPRAAALLDVSPVTDVTEISGSHQFVRPIYAGNALCTVKYTGESPCILTVRAPSFPVPASETRSDAAPITQVDLSAFGEEILEKSRFVKRSTQETERPDLGNARIVVTGGRGLKSAENFKMIEKLAEKLDAAVGATRAAVDAGFIPNELQVGHNPLLLLLQLHFLSPPPPPPPPYSNPTMSSNKEEHPLSFSNPNPSSSSPITLSEGDNSSSYLLEPQIGSASNSFQSDSILYDSAGTSTCDPDFGFFRPDFRQNTLLGSVQFYDRHVFLCYKNPRNWPPRIEAAEFDRLPRLLSAALAARKSDMKKETRLTICEGRDGTETSNGDVLIFPDMIRYRRLTHFDVDTFVEEVLIKDGEWIPGNPEKLKGFYIFVCCHGSRDRRCGVCGPPLVARFKEEVDLHGLQGKVSIGPCSHVGGHKYAGNVIIFGSGIDGEVTGHWYGYVTPDDVPNLLEQHVLKGEIVEWLWRGQMGLSEDDQQKAQELRLQNKEGNHSGNNRQLSSELPESPTGVSHSGSNGCCQANGNAACCQYPTSVGKEDDFVIHDGEVKVANGKKGKKLLRNNSYNELGKRKVCAMPSWFESWEREDTYAALAVVCAAVSVGIAYSCYKQL